MKLLSLIPVLILAWSPLLSAPAVPAAKKVLPDPEVILSGSAALKALELQGQKMEEAGEAAIVKLEGEPYAEALRLTTKIPCTSVWDVQVGAKIPVAVQAGDVMLATFAVRSVSGGAEAAEGRTEFIFEKNSEPWTKSAEVPVPAPRKWQEYSIPFVVQMSLAAEENHTCFRMGYKPQSIEIADFKLVRYPAGVDFKDLPRTRTTYKGREWDAPWRKEALKRIQKVRKGPLTVTVKDASGKPVAGANVMVKMTRHAFRWGTAIKAKTLNGFDMDPETYKAKIPLNFNHVVFENDMKWPFWEDGLKPDRTDWKKQWVDDTMDWAEKEGFTIRGHCLVWPSWRNLPPRLKALEGDCEALKSECLKRVKDMMAVYKGRIDAWDVVNEPVQEHELMDLCGNGILAEWFKAAKEVDPKARLFINEYGIFSGGGADVGTQDATERWVKELLDAGAPVDGIGIQSHLGQTPTDPELMLQLLDRFGKFGKDIEITEFDFDPQGDDELAYEYMKDYLIAMFSHPSVTSVLMWGFWDGSHWHSMAPLYAMDWTLKPMGKAWREMVYKEWWTTAAGRTDVKGAYAVGAFHGDYDVTVTFGGKTGKAKAKVGPEGKSVVVTLK